MKLRPFLLATAAFFVLVTVAYNVDWGFNALRLYMAASQPLEVEDPPHLEQAGEGEEIWW